MLPCQEAAITARRQLRPVESAADSGDPLVRRERLEAAHPEVTILPPATLNSRWLAVVPPGSVPGDPMRTMLAGWQLEELLVQLERIWPPEDGG